MLISKKKKKKKEKVVVTFISQNTRTLTLGLWQGLALARELAAQTGKVRRENWLHSQWRRENWLYGQWRENWPHSLTTGTFGERTTHYMSRSGDLLSLTP